MNPWPLDALDSDGTMDAGTIPTGLSGSRSQVPLVEALYVSLQRLQSLVLCSPPTAKGCPAGATNSHS